MAMGFQSRGGSVNGKGQFLPAAITALLILIGSDSRSRVPAADDANKVEPIVVTGQVSDADGKPAVGAVVRVQSINTRKRVDETATAGQDGRFELSVPVERESLANARMHARSADGSQLGYFRFPYDGAKTASDSVAIKLEPTKLVRVKVVDADAKPVPDARVGVQLDYPHVVADAVTNEMGIASMRLPKSERINAVVAWKDHAGLDYRLYSLSREQRADVNATAPEFPVEGEETLTLDGAAPLSISVVDDQLQPLDGVHIYPWLLKKESESDDLNLSYFTPHFSRDTDSGGNTTFHWLPAWQKSPITVWSSSEKFVHTRGTYDPQIGSGLLQMQIDRLVPIRGRVVGADGKPAGGITVAASGDGYSIDSGRETTKTDEHGQYELLVPPEQIYLVVIKDERWAAAPQDGFAVSRNQPVDHKDFTLREATRVFGTLTNEQTHESIPNERVIVYQYGQDLNSLPHIELPNPESSREYVRPIQTYNTTTDDQGRFEFALGDGNFDIRPPQQEKVDKFEISGQSELELQVTTKVQRKMELLGLVMDATGDGPLAGVRVTGVPRDFRGQDWQAVTGAEGKFRVQRYQQPTYVHALSADRRLAAIGEVEALTRTFLLELQPVGSARGRMLTSDLSGPVAGQKIEYGVRVPDEDERTWSYRFGGLVVTTADGTFQLTGLVPGSEYTLNLPPGPDGTIPTLTRLTVSPGESLDLGDLPAPAPRQPFVPPTLEDRIKSAFDVSGTPLERRDRAIELTDLVNQHALFVFGIADDPRIRRLMDIRYNDADYRAVSDEYRIVAIPTDEARRKAAEELARAFDESLADGRGDFLLVVLDRTGKKVATADSPSLCNGDELSKDKLLELLRRHLTKPLDARQLLADALARAAKENKRVIVQETATWCGPCHLLSRFLDGHRVWEKDYIWVKMDHRWTGARELMAAIRDGADGGIPWFAILDAEGNALATSNDPKTKENIGYPAEKSGQVHFANMLNSTRQRLSEEDVSQLIEALSSSEIAGQ